MADKTREQPGQNERDPNHQYALSVFGDLDQFKDDMILGRDYGLITQEEAKRRLSDRWDVVEKTEYSDEQWALMGEFYGLPKVEQERLISEYKTNRNGNEFQEAARAARFALADYSDQIAVGPWAEHAWFTDQLQIRVNHGQISAGEARRLADGEWQLFYTRMDFYGKRMIDNFVARRPFATRNRLIQEYKVAKWRRMFGEPRASKKTQHASEHAGRLIGQELARRDLAHAHRRFFEETPRWFRGAQISPLSERSVFGVPIGPRTFRGQRVGPPHPFGIDPDRPPTKS